MKKYLLVLCVLFLGTFYFLNNENVSSNLEESDFNIELSGLTGAEKFALYHANIRKSPAGSSFKYKSGYQVSEYEKLKKRLPETSTRNVNWEERGPGNVSGRTRTVWIDPRDTSGATWFVGSAQGGVWKTEDGGDSYNLKTPDVPHMGTAAIMGCKLVPEVIYAGSGEGFNFLSPAGAGIYKSIDGGETWSVLASTVNNSAFANVLRLAVDPENPDVVFAATRNDNSDSDVKGFVMRSKDGGETWEEVLFHFDIIPHIVMSPDNGNVLFAGLNQEGVLKSVDGGDNWDFVWLYESPELRPGRIEIAISPSDPNYVYFTTPINDVEFFPGDKIFASNDGGENFQLVVGNDAKDDYSEFSGGQSFWNKTIAVDPFNPLKIYFAGQSAFLSMDIQIFEGLTIGEMSVISDGYFSYSEYFQTSTKGVHVDHHGIYFSITDETAQEAILINTNDGGVAVSRDNGATFKQTGDTFLQGFNPEQVNWETVDGYNVSTFYGVDKMNGADRYVGGTQDNGSWVSPLDPDDTSKWSWAPSGDGFEAAWNYDDSNLIIESSQYNNFNKSTDGGETWFRLATPSFGPFISSIANSKQDGDMIMISTNDGPALSNDFGETWTVSTVSSVYQFSGLRTPIDISLFTPDVVWTGTGVNNGNRLVVSKDGGQTFTSTSQYGLQNLGEVAGIATHPADAATAYAVFGTAGQPKIIRTTDFGESWEDISGFEGSVDGTSSRGFPDVAVYSLLVMPYDNNIIWAGTEIGIIESLDNGESWNLVDDGLPATSIWEMKIINDEVVVATHGRGIWTASLEELDGYEPPAPFLIASRLVGEVFDKKITGVVKHITPIDSGMVTISVQTSGELFTRNYPLGKVESPTEEAIYMDLEDFDIGDLIYDAELSITVYRDGELRTKNNTYLFYDVDLDDPIEAYSDDFDEGNEDFAVGQTTGNGADFVVATPNGFENNGLESGHSFSNGQVYRTIFQKPIIIPATGSTLSFDEIALLQPANTGNFTESIILEATNDRGKTWKRIARYSSENNPDWKAANASNSDGSSDLYRNRNIKLSNLFEEGDEVFFKIEMYVLGFPFSWGYILDNFRVTGTVSTEEEINEKYASLNTFLNPFINSTRLELNVQDVDKIGNAFLTDMNGQVVNAAISTKNITGGVSFEIDGTHLASGVYFFTVKVGKQLLSKKLVRL